MLKLIILGRRRPEATRAQAHRHLMHVHGAMVIAPPADAGAMPRDYVQNHVFDAAYPRGADAAHALERDLVTELWFESPQDLGDSTATPYYVEHLQPDEDNFVDRSTVVGGLYTATERRAPSAGPFKLFAFLKAAGAAADGFGDALAVAVEGLIGAAGVQDVVINTPLRRPGVTPFTDAVAEFWLADAAAAAALAQTLRPTLEARLGPEALDRTACVIVLAEEFTTARLRELVL